MQIYSGETDRAGKQRDEVALALFWFQFHLQLQLRLGFATWTYIDAKMLLLCKPSRMFSSSSLSTLFLSSSPPYYLPHPPNPSSKTPGQCATTDHLCGLVGQYANTKTLKISWISQRSQIKWIWSLLEKFTFPFCLNFHLIFEKSEISSNIPVTNILHQTTFPIRATLRGQQWGELSQKHSQIWQNNNAYCCKKYAKNTIYVLHLLSAHEKKLVIQVQKSQGNEK